MNKKIVEYLCDLAEMNPDVKASESKVNYNKPSVRKKLEFTKEVILEEQLSKINEQMFSLPDLVWDSEYHVDEKATAKVCPEYVRLVEEYERLANELNTLKHRRLGLTVKGYSK